MIFVSGCQQQPNTAGHPGAFDGVYHGDRTLVIGSCDPRPTTLNLRIRNSHFAARDGGMVFDVDQEGDIGGFGLFQSSGRIQDGHMQVTLRGSGPRACTYLFDMRLSPPT